MMDSDDGPTIEQEIKWNNELSPAQKKLLLQQVKLDSFRLIFGAVLYLFFAGFVGMLFKGWLRPMVMFALIWAGVIGYTLLEGKEQRIRAALDDENRNQQEIKSGRARKETPRISG